MKKVIILLLTLALMATFVAAEDTIQIDGVTSNIDVEQGQEASYVYTLTNLDRKLKTFQIQADPFVGLPSSNFQYMFVEPNLVTLGGQESVEVTVNLLPREGLKTGKRYKSFFTVKSLEGDEDVEPVQMRQNLEIFLLAPTKPVTMSLKNYANSVSPRDEMVVTLSLVNHLDRDLSNVDLYLTSDIYEDEKTVQVFKGQDREVDFSFPISNTVTPQDYDFSVRLYYDDELIGSEGGTFTVTLNSDVDISQTDEKEFLRHTFSVTKKNSGNSIVEEAYRYDVPLFQGWFTAYNIQPSAQSDGGKEWYFKLAPEEDYTITITVDYRPLVVSLIVLLLLAIIVYYLVTKRLIIKKESFKLKYGVDGLSDFKVLLHVKNNTNKTIKDVTVIDRLPKVIQPSTDFGTLRPSGVERGDKGIRMMWKIPELLKGEERIISYRVTPRMKIIGDLDLPRALAKYRNKSKRTIRTSSNMPRIYSGVMEKKVQNAPTQEKKRARKEEKPRKRAQRFHKP